MEREPAAGVVDSLTLRFEGEDEDGTALHELRAAHVAEVLQGVVGLASDFSKAGAFGDGPGAEVLVRPAREGSFIIEVVRTLQDNPVLATAIVGTPPSLSSIIWWATKSARADIKDFTHLDNGNVKVCWQDDSVQEVPLLAWQELQKRGRRRKKQLRQIMAPLSDKRVTSLDVVNQGPPTAEAPEETSAFTLSKPDYDAVRPDDEIEERQNIFETEAQMSAIDFDNAAKWRVKTKDRTRSATVEDKEFLGRVGMGLAIRKSDIFTLRVREDATVKNGRTTHKWTVLEVKSHRRAVHDDDA